MPLYEYECPHGHRFEKLLLLKDHKNTATCETCGEEALQTFSPAVTRFKNEKYNTWEPSFDRPYAPVSANPWRDDTDR